VGALALAPAISMLVIVQGGNPMQWLDYWDVLPRVTNSDGSFAPRGMFEYQNEHPVAIPALIYWVNAHLTGGSNVALGTLVVAIVAAQVAILGWALPRRITTVFAWRAAFVAVAAALLFATRGTHNFLLAMSGTAWLTANLFAIIALFVAWRRGPLLALPFAALASLSYGTGLAVWPVLVLLAVLERRPRWLVAATAGATVVAAGAYLLGYEAPDQVAQEDRTLVGFASRICEVLGSPFTENLDLAGMLGAGLLGLTGFAVWSAWRRGVLADVAPWIGLGAYALLGAAFISISRSGGAVENSTSSRYVSLGALAWLATLVLVAAVFPARPVAVAGAAVAAVVALVGGHATIEEIRALRFESDAIATALRLGAVPDPNYVYFNDDAVAILPRLDHYPFNDDYDLDCGLLGERLDPATLDRTIDQGGPPVTEGWLDGYVTSEFTGVARVSGWAGTSRDIRCILLVDGRGEVVGTATHGVDRPDLRGATHFQAWGFTGVARQPPLDETLRAVVLLEGDHPPVVLQGRLSGADVPTG